MLKFKNIGFIVGVPARDLTDQEAKIYGGEQELISSGLYEKKEIQAKSKSTDDRKPVAKDGEK